MRSHSISNICTIIDALFDFRISHCELIIESRQRIYRVVLPTKECKQEWLIVNWSFPAKNISTDTLALYHPQISITTSSLPSLVCPSCRSFLTLWAKRSLYNWCLLSVRKYVAISQNSSRNLLGCNKIFTSALFFF